MQVFLILKYSCPYDVSDSPFEFSFDDDDEYPLERSPTFCVVNDPVIFPFERLEIVKRWAVK